MRRAFLVVLVVALALMALAPMAAAAVERGPVYVGCETVQYRDGAGRGAPLVEETHFKVVVNGDVKHERQVDECPMTV